MAVLLHQSLPVSTKEVCVRSSNMHAAATQPGQICCKWWKKAAKGCRSYFVNLQQGHRCRDACNVALTYLGKYSSILRKANRLQQSTQHVSHRLGTASRLCATCNYRQPQLYWIQITGVCSSNRNGCLCCHTCKAHRELCECQQTLQKV